ncbi:DNA damage-responsive repressor GIS1/RPH1, jumonji superfamily [Plasmopara halstedii]|uniref:DNA damage-responsive repressor GIS1/RPH1, jumonji superfamily n=1 Tax=Plasmopara halstedii TaxID=4781 RepID=A0A0P1AT02_PLAHL|nr:DNA damage-responsive repressor GIS1/RPH1, jumonji superfamily [Plasmopara halstedii]CEG44695.1 DNA damage-responsive repressor GIS1/RPH1, jumonji superfamily [Plasmopara halstedii]|eukprot:XP_024581064.1 DNA damage-responsive repressor GIS1/RPH1, jumonji superfamily [Plasmopara halstedii]
MCPSDDHKSSSLDVGWCPVYYPTHTEFQSFATYIRTVVEPQCANIGICKVIPPSGWFSRSYDISQLKCQVKAPVCQHVAGKKGIFNVDLVERKSMSPEEFHAVANVANNQEPKDNDDLLDVERRFWKGLRGTMDPPIYGADIVASLFGDADALSWNLNDLNTILRTIDLPGVTQSMLYFGMWRAMFAFHTEDMDLYSINYLHTGKPKFWYGVPPHAATQLERAAQSMFPEKYHECTQFLRHKTSLISPARLKEFGVPFFRACQKPGEFVITFPATYHQGFNFGFNIAEAVNFATLHWIPYGLKAKICKCHPDSVRIDMDSFLMRLFEEPRCDSEAIGEDPWIFSCKCNKYCSSNSPHVEVEEQWFECSKCKIWAHVRCIHSGLADLAAEDLPQSLLCHRCLAEVSCGKPYELSSVGVGRRGGSAVKVIRRKLGKRRKEALICPRSEAARVSAITLSPQNKAALRSNDGGSYTLKSTAKNRAANRKHRLIKGSIIRFESTEAKISAVQGKFVRVHYKGESLDKDEWLPMNSKKLSQGIVSVVPPVPKRKE